MVHLAAHPLPHSQTPADQPPTTLADVIALVAGDATITKRQRQDRLCALRVLARVLGQNPRLIRATPEHLATRFKGVAPAAHGLTVGRWANVRSRVLTAMAQAGIAVMPGRSTMGLSPAWLHLRQALPDPEARIAMSRLMSFCTAQGVEPGQVDQAVFDRFAAALQTDSVIESPHRVNRAARAAWNKAAGGVAGWPALIVNVPRSTRFYSFGWPEFQVSFITDVEAFLSHAGNPDPFADDYARPLRPDTLTLRRSQIRQMASLLGISGLPLLDVTSLATLVVIPNARAILTACRARVAEGSSQLHHMALLLKVIAEGWVKAPPATVDTLVRYARNIARPAGRMTEKNRNRLRQFDNPENMRQVLNLPRKVFRELKRSGPPDRAAALRALCAVAVELLIVVPLRISNLLSLDFEQRLVPVGRGTGAVAHIVIPAHEMKGRKPYEAAIPEDTAQLLADYRVTYLPLITTVPTPLLLPNEKGGRRDKAAFSNAITEFVLRETGLIMNPHLFRHFAVTEYLKKHPDDIETARRILSHSSRDITLNKYAYLAPAAAYQRFDEFIAELRDTPATKTREPSSAQRGR